MFNSSNCAMPFSMDVVPAGYNNGGNGNGMWGGDWAWWIVILLIFGWGNGGWGGFGNNGGGGALTRGELCQDMNFNDLQSGVRDVQNNLQNGFRNIDNAICTLGYNNAQLANGIQMQVAGGFANLDTELCQVTNNITQSINGVSSQIAGCCCDLRSGLKDIQFQNAQDTCAVTTALSNATRDIVENQNANYRAIHDEIVANRIEDKNAEIARQNQQIFQLQLAASQANQNQYLVEQLSPKCWDRTFLTCNPYTGQTYTNGYGYGGNCGCSGCGC